MPVTIPPKEIVIDLTKKDAAAQAATIAVEQAEQASKDGTFGVGGLMIDNKTGKVLATARNQVIQDGRVMDPTGHVERQLVDWYHEQKKAGVKLPDPKDITIVSSLDPCVMCGGGIINTEFNVISVARDDFAGVTYKKLGNFDAMPEGLRDAAGKKMAYFGVTGDKDRPFSGPDQSSFKSQEIPKALLDRSNGAFLSSLDRVKDTINSYQGVVPEKLKDLGTLKADDELIALLKKINPRIQTLKVDPKQPADKALGDALLDEAAKAKKSGAKLNAVALVAPNGQVLHIRGGSEQESPNRSAYMEMIRDYTKMRADAGAKGKEYLPHPKHCKVVFLCGPDQSSHDFMNLGAVGSTMEGPVPKENKDWLQYIVPSQPQKKLDEMVDALPPLYSKVIGIKVTQCSDGDVVRQCTAKLDAIKALDKQEPKKDNAPQSPVRMELGNIEPLTTAMGEVMLRVARGGR